MTNRPDPQKIIASLQERVHYLEDIHHLTLDALDKAAKLGNFQASINQLQSPTNILHETYKRIKTLINFDTIAFYLIDEENSEFYFAFCEPTDRSAFLQAEIEKHIQQGTFAWAIREEKALFLPVQPGSDESLLLQVMTTHSRIRGMFAGFLRHGHADVPLIHLSLLSIILMHSANALESYELYGIVRHVNQNLTQMVEDRSRELEYRQKFETLIARISSSFMNLACDETDHAIDVSLQALADFTHADTRFLYLFSQQKKALLPPWKDQQESPISALIHADDYPFFSQQIDKMEPFIINGHESLPPHAQKEKKLMQKQKLQTLLIVPMRYSQKTRGFFGLGFRSQQNEELLNIRNLFKIVAEIFINAIKFEESELRYRDLFDNLIDIVLLVDRNGKISMANSRFYETFDLKGRDDIENFSVLSLVHPQDFHKVRKQLIEPLQTERDIQQFQFRIQPQNHGTMIMECNAKCILKENRFFGYQIVLRNITERKRLEENLVQSYQNLKNVKMATILGLAKLAEHRDQDTGTHLERIREYARLLAERLSLNPRFAHVVNREFIEDIYNSSILHDIGKVGIPDNILLKQGRLTAEEFEIIKQHPILGGDTLKAVECKVSEKSFLALGIEIAYFHHEKWDGTGYPFGLKGEQIPISARIVALADVYDALTSRRIYKKEFSHYKAREIIIAETGKHFDPAVVEAFIEQEQQFKTIRCKMHDTDLLDTTINSRIASLLPMLQEE